MSDEDLDDEEDDNVIDMDESVASAIIGARLKTNEKPPDIVTEDYLVDITFHPSLNLIAGASISGDAIV